MTKHFKRNIFGKILIVEMVLCVTMAMMFLFPIKEEHRLVIMAVISALVLLTCIFYSFICATCFPDFRYSIEVHNDSFTIMMPDEEKHTFSKSFTITRTYPWRTILKDETNSITIPSNKKVLEFLNQIQIEQ